MASLLPQADYSHMARYALESIPAPQAVQAMHEALSDVPNELKVGIISSLGARQDAESVPALAQLLSDDDPSVARAAALALGAIGGQERTSRCNR